MNRKLTLILIGLGVVLIVYNLTLVNFSDPLEGKSVIALIGIVASLCAIILLLIFKASKKIQQKIDRD